MITPAATLHAAALARPELVEYAEDLTRLPDVAIWAPAAVAAAIDDLVADGRITEAADGRLCVHPEPRP